MVFKDFISLKYNYMHSILVFCHYDGWGCEMFLLKQSMKQISAVEESIGLSRDNFMRIILLECLSSSLKWSLWFA